MPVSGAMQASVRDGADDVLPSAAEALGMVRWHGRTVRLSRIEQAVFACLARAPTPMSRSALLVAVWGYRFDPGTNLLAVHVCRLRAKLGPGSIVHEGGGYLLRGASAASCNSGVS